MGVLTREALLERYRSVRSLTGELCGPLKVEDYVVQTMTDVSPTKWHLGHTTWFFETVILKNHVRGYSAHHSEYGYIFNSYYESFGDRVARPQRGFLTRPTVEEVFEFRSVVDERMTLLLESLDEKRYPAVAELIAVGLNHEQQHQELLLTDIKHVFSVNPLYPAYTTGSHTPAPAPPELKFVRFDEGVQEIGWGGEGFAYDNEGPRHKVYLKPFGLASRLVTNREYLRFIEDGGYEQPRFWLSDGWDAVKTQGWTAPIYWEKHDDGWFEFTLHGMRPLDLNEPVVHVTQYEAAAFANWAGKRLPTEAEWEVAAVRSGGRPQTDRFMEARHLHPRGATGATGLQQMFGDAWEWTSSAYLAYPGYHAPSGALGEYNAKFMSRQVVLRGGSCLTPLDHIRPTYRNFFQPDKRWQMTGLRLAED